MSSDLRESNQSELSASTGNGVKPVTEFRTDERLAGIERELRTQGREAKKMRQAYGIFAVLAVGIGHDSAGPRSEPATRQGALEAALAYAAVA